MDYIACLSADGSVECVRDLPEGEDVPNGAVLLTVFTGMPAPPSHAAALRVVAGRVAWVDCRTLAQARAERWEAMKAARDALEFGVFEWDGSVFDATPDSQRRIEGAFVLAISALSSGGTFTRDWTLADNSVRTLTAADMVQVGQALGDHVAAAHEAGRLARERIEAAPSIQDIDAVEWSAGTS